MAKPKRKFDPLADPLIWRQFLTRLSGGTDPYHDFEMIQSFAEAAEVEPERVWLKLKPIIRPPTATRH